jgi:hypothetical protein
MLDVTLGVNGFRSAEKDLKFFGHGYSGLPDLNSG